MGPEDIGIALQKEEIKSPSIKNRKNSYISPETCPQPGARSRNVLERVKKFEALNLTRNEKTYNVHHPGGHGIDILKENKKL